MANKNIFRTVLLPAIFVFAVIIIIRNIFSDTGITVTYPFNDAVFPPEFPAPTFVWSSERSDSSLWEIKLETEDESYHIQASTDKTSWTPDELKWDSLKYFSKFENISFSVHQSGSIRNSEHIMFSLSPDSVGAPILYRQMPIPSLVAERQLDSMSYKLIDIGSKNPPHVAMKGFVVCGNCHSFTADGSTIALDLDAGARDKGGYFVSDIEDTILFNIDNYMSWSKIEKRRTFGLFSKISPDGRYIATTVKDRVVFYNYPANTLENVKYSQLFFPVNGYLAIYDRQTKTLKELPGANLKEYVQSNAIWTPDGENIIFSRADALPREDINEYVVQNDTLISQYLKRERGIKFNLCIIPFNNGNGGEAIPIEGASNNGKSNYFPAVSPDGKWLAYCQAEDFMLLMPDSRLYMIPVEGGAPRLLKSNFNSMNSWHAWSPNSKWLVFVSKGLSAYTDMFLTHIDENGQDEIPVLVDKARELERVVNYPEFVNRNPKDLFTMNYDYVELKHMRQALQRGDREKVKELYYRMIAQNPYLFPEDYQVLVTYLKRIGMTEEAEKYTELAAPELNTDVNEND